LGWTPVRKGVGERREVDFLSPSNLKSIFFLYCCVLESSNLPFFTSSSFSFILCHVFARFVHWTIAWGFKIWHQNCVRLIKQIRLPAQPKSMQIASHHSEARQRAFTEAERSVWKLSPRRPAFATLPPARRLVEWESRRDHWWVCCA